MGRRGIGLAVALGLVTAGLATVRPAAAALATRFVAVTPTRLLDTRESVPTPSPSSST
jgi:hypothetical protein